MTTYFQKWLSEAQVSVRIQLLWLHWNGIFKENIIWPLNYWRKWKRSQYFHWGNIYFQSIIKNKNINKRTGWILPGSVSCVTPDLWPTGYHSPPFLFHHTHWISPWDIVIYVASAFWAIGKGSWTSGWAQMGVALLHLLLPEWPPHLPSMPLFIKR